MTTVPHCMWQDNVPLYAAVERCLPWTPVANGGRAAVDWHMPTRPVATLAYTAGTVLQRAAQYTATTCDKLYHKW